MYAVIQLSRDPTAGRSKSIRHEYLRSHKRSESSSRFLSNSKFSIELINGRILITLR